MNAYRTFNFALVLGTAALTGCIPSTNLLFDRGGDPPVEMDIQIYENQLKQELKGGSPDLGGTWNRHWGTIKWSLKEDPSYRNQFLLSYIDRRRRELHLPDYEAVPPKIRDPLKDPNYRASR